MDSSDLLAHDEEEVVAQVGSVGYRKLMPRGHTRVVQLLCHGCQPSLTGSGARSVVPVYQGLIGAKQSELGLVEILFRSQAMRKASAPIFESESPDGQGLQ